MEAMGFTHVALYMGFSLRQGKQMSSGVTNLEDIVSRFHICDVDPLAVDVRVVGIITSWAQALHIGQHPHKRLCKQTYFL